MTNLPTEQLCKWITRNGPCGRQTSYKTPHNIDVCDLHREMANTWNAQRIGRVPESTEPPMSEPQSSEQLCIFALTAPGSNCPEYISVNEKGLFRLEFTVRSVPQGEKCGETATIVLTEMQVRELADGLGKWLYLTAMLP